MQNSEKISGFASILVLIHPHLDDLDAVSGGVFESLVSDWEKGESSSQQNAGGDRDASVYLQITLLIKAVDSFYGEQDATRTEKERRQIAHRSVSRVFTPDVHFQDIAWTEDVFS